MDIIALIALVIIGIVVVTLPIYLAAKVVAKKASFGRAIIAAFLGPVLFYIVFVLIGSLTALAFGFLLPLAFIIALIFLIYFYSVIFDTSFLGGLLIAIIAVLITVVIMFLLSFFSFFALSFPGGRRFGFSGIFILVQAYHFSPGMISLSLLPFY